MKSRIFADFYESLFNNTFDGLAYCQMIFDEQGRPVDWVYLEVNKNFENLTGLRGVIDKKVTELVPGIFTSNPELFEIYGKVSLTGESKKFETYVEPLSKWFEVSVYSSKSSFFMAVFKNITNQKKIEEDLINARVAARNVLEDLQVEKENIARLRAEKDAMLSSIGDGIIATDDKGILIFMNKAAESMLGWNLKEIQGQILSSLILVENQEGKIIPEAERPMSIALATVTSIIENKVCFYVKKDKTRLPVAITAAPILLGKEVIGAIEVFRDIAKEKEIEKLRVDFLSLASHQLRTPLSGTKWLIETLGRKILGPINIKQKEYLDQIYRINERMIKLVFDMLSTLRLENGIFPVKNEKVLISKIYDGIIKNLGPVAKSKKVVLKNVYKDSETIETDFDVISLVIDCFVSNAINYSEPGKEIILDVKKENGAFVFSIKDSGIGIPQEEQKEIFKRFYRASNAKEFKPDGTGLGLYIASMLAEKIGAKVSFKSEKNEGTTFFLTFKEKQK